MGHTTTTTTTTTTYDRPGLELSCDWSSPRYWNMDIMTKLEHLCWVTLPLPCMYYSSQGNWPEYNVSVVEMFLTFKLPSAFCLYLDSMAIYKFSLMGCMWVSGFGLLSERLQSDKFPKTFSSLPGRLFYGFSRSVFQSRERFQFCYSSSNYVGGQWVARQSVSSLLGLQVSRGWHQHQTAC